MIGIMLVRNEADRWLETVLTQMQSVCRKIVILDDCSTDNTPEICKKYTPYVWKSCESLWATNEVWQRKLLWMLAADKADPGEWILCLDADETMPGINKLLDYATRAENYDCDGLSFNLFDMWSPTQYRDDDLWTAHLREWVMCVKYDPAREYLWRETKLHCGRFPVNACERPGQTGLSIQHWGWSRPEDRKIKHERYMEADPGGKDGSLAQYLSILDPNPKLKEFTA